jgi:hypothetical protein
VWKDWPIPKGNGIEHQKVTGEKNAKMKQTPNLNADNTVSNNNQPLNSGVLVGK